MTKFTRKLYDYEGVPTAELRTAILPPDAADSFFALVWQDRAKALEKMIEENALPRLELDYRNSPHPQKKFSFSRLIVTSALDIFTNCEGVLSVFGEFRVEKEGRVWAHRMWAETYDQNGRFLPADHFCPRSALKKTAAKEKLSLGRLLTLDYYLHKNRLCFLLDGRKIECLLPNV